MTFPHGITGYYLKVGKDHFKRYGYAKGYPIGTGGYRIELSYSLTQMLLPHENKYYPMKVKMNYQNLNIVDVDERDLAEKERMIRDFIVKVFSENQIGGSFDKR